ncbi:MAG TPA: hypothetical protein VFO41_13745 [Alphaproteobacteria bacterium]|nr:hypothetical protein [Alphaproteobacteria bacterium]
MSSLAPWQGPSPATREELDALAAAAWHRAGKLYVDPDRLADPAERQALIALAERLYGRRGGRH